MNDQRETDPSPDNAPPSEGDAGAPESIRRIFARAGRLAARERVRAARRGPLSKALGTAGLGLTLATAAILFYGAIAFRDAPIRATPDGFAGKTGKTHTRVEYERFKVWERLLLGAFGLVFLFGVAIVVEEKVRERAKRE